MDHGPSLFRARKDRKSSIYREGNSGLGVTTLVQSKQSDRSSHLTEVCCSTSVATRYYLSMATTDSSEESKHFSAA